MTHRYPISPSGIFWTIQGEGSLLGVPQVFIRLAGCSIGCQQCDTDYSVSERLSTAEIIERVQRCRHCEWVWITGGEPTDHPLAELVAGLHLCGYRVALATAGMKSSTVDGWSVRVGSATGGVDFLSVSPHEPKSDVAIMSASQLNLVPGLGRLSIDEWDGADLTGFGRRYITPLFGSISSVSECVEFASRNHGFRLGIQAHKFWGLA